MPKLNCAKTELVVEKSPSKARRSLNMQASVNGVYSNGHKREVMQAEKGSRNDARNGMHEESVDKQCHYTVCDQQPNGNGSIRTPKKGACREPDVLRTPKSPRKKLNNLSNQIQKWNPKDSSQILAVKAALHLSAVPTTVICREEELKNVFEFCKMCIEKKKVGSMYVCGCPGTGKSLLLEKVKCLSIEWAKEVGMPPPTSVVVNCTSLTNTSDIFAKILEQCQGKKKCSANSSPFLELKSFLCEKKQSSAKKMLLLIIDEMDYLITKDQAVLYDLFRLPTFPNSHCMLIGISNAIDLTDRFLPKLQSLNCEPLVMTFRAYSKDQILKILQQRLMGLTCQVFQPEALELCARKVAAASGDMRKALHVCRGAVEMLEAELTNGIHELDNISHEKSMTNGLNLPPEERLTKQEINMVRIDHMARALAKTFRSAVVDTIQSLPRHQQIVLCSAVKFFRRRKKDATLGELNAAYLDFCKTTSMYPLTGPEFSSMCRVLSDQALLNLGQSREDRLRRVTLKVDEGDVSFALQGIRFFRNCLQ
jgi:cell division control protein 6